MNARRIVLMLCLCLLGVRSVPAQNSTSIPARPSASDTLIVKPKPPKPRDIKCVPGAACNPSDPRDPRDPRDPPPPQRPEQPAVPDAPTPEAAADTEDAPASDLRAPAAGSPGAINTSAPAAPAAAASTQTRELLVAAADVAEGDAQRAWFAQQGVGVLRRRVL